MDKEINIKVILSSDYIVDNNLLTEIINGLNDKLVPVHEITVDDKIMFNNTLGFRVQDLNNTKEEN